MEDANEKEYKFMGMKLHIGRKAYDVCVKSRLMHSRNGGLGLIRCYVCLSLQTTNSVGMSQSSIVMIVLVHQL